MLNREDCTLAGRRFNSYTRNNELIFHVPPFCLCLPGLLISALVSVNYNAPNCPGLGVDYCFLSPPDVFHRWNARNTHFQPWSWPLRVKEGQGLGLSQSLFYIHSTRLSADLFSPNPRSTLNAKDLFPSTLSLSQEETSTMARREFCTCCGKYVTLVQLAKHTEEAARQKNIITMGGDPTSPVTTAPGSIPPITGNDIFESRVVYETPSVVDEGISNTVPYTNSLPATSLPPYFTEDEDFPPGPVEGTPKPPQGPTPVDEYPSLYVPEDDDGDGSEDDDKDNNGNTDDGMPDLEKFMDWEYIKQGNPCLSMPIFSCQWLKRMSQLGISQIMIWPFVEPSRFSSEPSSQTFNSR